ncbi:gamma-glutamyl-gamma-aminobutyrate hydrolase family protein [Tissierella sp. Yu-01]|uniref:gamma-glutamyl-gamma-aminobutyrate hydrolase family protein n=1 Tax=Tissierella sp. Yu-01 TaxID=3035694 RepID=UPI00240E3744|nr:gamma-glutamyl-gamma-aminobutyrate hydrolase family protein [Tissierella sp. Yu-01]WFA08198.1 gamma-glutamyl-gamma-aminobutyrate hydrolase family protein [Tissierella sp. Yu-01]
MKPVIGLTCSSEDLVNGSLNKLNDTYINAVYKGGATPIIIPILKNGEHIEDYLEIVDGIVFTGGGDVSPLYFGEDPINELGQIDYDRDLIEMALFQKAYEKGIPIFGICRGLQLLNIALGGDIYQDIYIQVPNVQGHTCMHNIQEGYHVINILEDSILYDIFKKNKLVVNSQHHQAIRKLGDNLKITARSNDGVIEAVESTNNKFVLGVQFHPEAMAVKYDEFLKPFRYFIDRCENLQQNICLLK